MLTGSRTRGSHLTRILCGLARSVAVNTDLLRPFLPRATRGVITRLSASLHSFSRLGRFKLCPSKAGMASTPRVLFTEVSTGRVRPGISTVRTGRGRRCRGGRGTLGNKRSTSRTIVSVSPGRRVAFSSFAGVRFRIKRVLSYRTITGSGGLLYSRMGVKGAMGRVMSNVHGSCAPRRVINGGIVILIGLGPTGLTKMLSRNVLLYTRSRGNALSLVAPRGPVPDNTRVYWAESGTWG